MMKLFYILFTFWLMTSEAMAAELPPAATPGGALPKEQFKYPKPFVYPNTSPPPEVEQKLEEVEKGAPRMRVKGFRIIGIDENIEIGITQQAIEQLVKESAEEMVATVATKGFSISMFEQITSAVARYYRERGYFLARAYIPEQTVNDGIVQINIVEGFLDQVLFSGNSLYKSEQLEPLFEPLIGESVFKPQIEQALFTLNDYPGLSTNMVFGPGLKPGSAAVQLNVSEMSSTNTFMLDNAGSIYTGENRWRYNHKSNNLFGQADLLDVNLILTTSPPNSNYFEASYQQPVIDQRFMAGGDLSLNIFDVGGTLSDLGINGESRDIHGFMRYLHSRNRTEKLTATAGVHLKSSVSKVRSTLDSEDKLTVLYLSGDYAGTSWSSSGAYQTANITLSLGLEDFLGSMDSNGNENSGRAGGSGDFAGGGFSKIAFSYSRIQPISELNSLMFSFRGQMSSDLLTSLEQFSLGGPDTIRAYPVAEALMDEAYLFSVEWMAYASPDIPQTLLKNLRLSVFYDYAVGSQNDPLLNEIESVSFSGFGGSAQMEPYDQFELKISLAFDLGDEPSDNMSLPFYFSVKYDF